ncbi:unnamed protein product [Didymodactylos carnosus]|uniref:ABC transporter domain-containing protein n=1 Tax=Didymodactylos carnosus TaxID=1234261 RepID=A0A8S2L5D6_9BILA|nr:unnamed protein product [Didymodactylos carnosus]CAF3884914.1 unnamed protein product [Didymodactylos carnosus]
MAMTQTSIDLLEKIGVNVTIDSISETGQYFLVSFNPNEYLINSGFDPIKPILGTTVDGKRRKKTIQIIRGINLEIRPGQIVGIVGESGSGGMRQRIVIAMMMACNPKILIADEPTTALDNTVQSSVLELFQEIRDSGVAIIFISHNISLVAKLCDYIYIFYAGKVVEKGKREEIFSKPAHPYTWALIGSIPDPSSDQKLRTIPGAPPNMAFLPSGDPFASRNPYALKIDFEKEPPMFKISPTHFAAT